MVRQRDINLVKNELKNILTPKDEEEEEYPSREKRERALRNAIDLIGDLKDDLNGAYNEGRADGMETMATILRGGKE